MRRRRSADDDDEEVPLGRAAADEVDDFKLVAVGDRGGGPGGAGDDGAVVFDSDAVRLEGEGSEEIVEGGCGGEGWESPRLAVDDEVHGIHGYRV